MGDFARGIADGMLQADLDSAQRSSASARRAADDAEMERYRARMEAARAKGAAEGWQAEAEKYKKAQAESWGIASAGLIVINAFIKYMETMPPMEREKMRQFVAHKAGYRMMELDNDEEFRKKYPHFPSIQKSFEAQLEQNAFLKIV